MNNNLAAAEKKKDDSEKPLTAMPPSLPKLERTTSIDDEPKTLLEDELTVAREAALKIINSHTKEEALKIFLTDLYNRLTMLGLVPVEAVVKDDDVVLSDCDDE